MATLTLLLVLFLHVSSVLPLGQRATVDRKKDENMDNILSKIEHGAGSSRDDTLQTFQAEDSNDLLRQVQAIAEEGQGIGKDLFELPRCHRSPWHRIAIFISYIAGELPKIGKYNHVTLVLAPATRNLYSSGPMKHPDGAFVYELSGTASEFLLHATIQGQSIAIPRTNRLKHHHSKKKMKFMFIGTVNCVNSNSAATATAATAITEEDQHWMEWEKNSGLVFVRPWSEIMLKFRELHDTVFKEQRRVGMPFKAAFRALFPKSKEKKGGENEHRYNFATFNCAHHVRLLLTNAFGMKEKNAERLVISDLKSFGFPTKWHKYEPFSLMNPKTTNMFERVSHQISYPRQSGIADGFRRYRCLKTPTLPGLGTPTRGNNNGADPFSCLTAWQMVDWEYKGDAGEMDTIGGYFQFQNENYANVWIEADPKLRKRLNEMRLQIGGRKSGEFNNPMGPIVNFKDKEEE